MLWSWTINGETVRYVCRMVCIIIFMHTINLCGMNVIQSVIAAGIARLPLTIAADDVARTVLKRRSMKARVSFSPLKTHHNRFSRDIFF
jgi:hypothetical protein